MVMKKLSSVSASTCWRPFSGVLRHPRFPRVHRLVHQLQQVGHPPGQLLGGQKRQNLAGLSSRSVINYYLRFFKMGQPRPGLFFRLFCLNVIKILVASGTQTQIVGIEGKDADHYPTSAALTALLSVST